MMNAKTKRTLANILLLLVVFGAFLGTGWYFFSLYDTFSRETVRLFVQHHGALGPVIFGLLYIVSAPIPFVAPVLSAVGGLLFGAGLGTLYVIGIATVSSFIPYTMARRLGREWVEAKLKGKKLEDIYESSSGRKGFLFILLMRLIPVLPWEVQNYVAGLTKVHGLTFAAATMLGIIPGSFSLAFLGSAATEPGSWEFVAAIALKVATGVLPAAISLISARGRRASKHAEERAFEIPADQQDVD